MLINSESEMLAYGQKIGEQILSAQNFPCVIELLGDVGAGKTTFTRGLAKGLGVKAELSSPSFTISRLYAGDGCVLAHYDFYRLADPGLMMEDLDESIQDERTVTVVEWGQAIKDIWPARRYTIKISYLDENSRELVQEGGE